MFRRDIDGQILCYTVKISMFTISILLTINNGGLSGGTQLLHQRIQDLGRERVDLEECIRRDSKPHSQQTLMDALQKDGDGRK